MGKIAMSHVGFPQEHSGGIPTAEDEMEDKERKRFAAEVGRKPPRPVAEVVVGKWKKGRSIKVHAHNQVLRIRAEDSHLGKDIGEGNLSSKDKFGVTHTQFVVFSRPISPLSGRTAY